MPTNWWVDHKYTTEYYSVIMSEMLTPATTDVDKPQNQYTKRKKADEDHPL